MFGCPNRGQCQRSKDESVDGWCCQTGSGGTEVPAAENLLRASAGELRNKQSIVSTLLSLEWFVLRNVFKEHTSGFGIFF